VIQIQNLNRMEREVLVKRTIGKIEQLSTTRVREVSDFVEFIIRKTDDAMITEGLQHLRCMRWGRM
jgi:hypothetical protein